MVERVRLLERPLWQIAEEGRTSGWEGAGGLLIGQVRGEVAWIEKVLPCRNVAPTEERHLRFTVAPDVLGNVRRSLQARPASILGSYRVLDRERYDWPTGMKPAWLAPGWLWLLANSEPNGTMSPQVWSSRDGRNWTELEIELIRPRARVLACPE